MNKIVLLMPALMLPNNREINMKSLDYARQHYGVDEIVINAQGFQDGDYVEGVTYIGHHPEGIGFTKARNELLEWLYNSDADWAVWMDANAKVSMSAMNDFRTLVAAIKEGKLDIDGIFSSLGIWYSAERVIAKNLSNYKTHTQLIKNCNYDWLHGLFMRNLNKSYGVELYINATCDPWKGTSEDAYFARIMKKLFDCRHCPTVLVSKPSSKTSTWMSNAGGYKYPPLDYPTIDEMIRRDIKETGLEARKQTYNTIVLPRVEEYKEMIADYKARPRAKNKKGGLLKND